MQLIYVYIGKFRNIVSQEIYFSDRYSVSYNPSLPFPSALSISRKEEAPAASIIYGDSKLSRLHLIVGKTGAGKTNILQLIGMPEYERIKNSEDDESYFLLYAADDSFVIETFGIGVASGLQKKWHEDSTYRKLPEDSRKTMHALDVMGIFRFSIENSKPVNVAAVSHCDELSSDLTLIFNGFERHAYPYCSYEKTRLNNTEPIITWQPRISAEFRNTSLWCSTRFLKEYIETFDIDSIKRKASLVIRCDSWADSIKQHIDESLLKSDYWTYIGQIGEEKELRIMGKKVKRHRYPSVRKQFVHDLLTDFALYLREFISYVKTWPLDIAEDHLDSTGKKDVFQEGIDYWYEKQLREMEEETGIRDRNPVDPTVLPDYKRIPILKRLRWLCMWIDRRLDGNPYGIFCQIADDIKDISEILMKFDDKYFTNETFTLPIEDMFTEKNRKLVEDLFERMEQYKPDDCGVFTEELLPYSFFCISSGEYQFAKIMGGIEEFCVRLSIDEGTKPNLVYLLDEPETYMHPELCRTLLKRMDDVLREQCNDADIQILISTHSPLLLSDVLPWQITRLDVDSKGYCLIRNGTEKTYFGANIHTILADGFFLDYTIGEYARVYLQKQFDWLKRFTSDSHLSESSLKKLSEIKKIVPCIGDSLIRTSFELLIRQIEEKL